MKKLTIILTIIITALCAFSACSKANSNTLRVGASITPHAEILEFVKDDFKALGYDLEVVIYTDYVTPNRSLASGDIDANYFQHLPFLNQFNDETGNNLVSACAVHYEPMGIFAKAQISLNALPSGCKLLIPADATNQARALLLLAKHNVITLKENASLASITILDVVNSNGHTLYPVEAASIPAQLNQGDNKTIAVINGNYALLAGYDLSTALATEDKESEAAITYANILAVNKGDENREDIKALVTLLTSEKVKRFITENYQGAVLPV